MKKYTIPRGKQRSGFHFRPWIGLPKGMTITFRLHDTCWYERPSSNVDWEDYWKIGGISFGFHHNNSYRIGGRPDYNQEGVFMLHHYLYTDGNRKYPHWKNVPVDTWHSENFVFQSVGNSLSISPYTERENERTIQVAGLEPQVFHDGPNVNYSETKYVLPHWWGYMLFPYHSGDKKAPQNVSIDLEIKLHR